MTPWPTAKSDGDCACCRCCGKIARDAVHSAALGWAVFVALACSYRRSGARTPAAASQIDANEDRVGTWLRWSVRMRQIARIVPPPRHLLGARRTIQARKERSAFRGSLARDNLSPDFISFIRATRSSRPLNRKNTQAHRQSAPTASATDLNPSLRKHAASSRLMLPTNCGPWNTSAE